MYVTIFIGVVHIFTCYLLVIVAELGIIGAALSMTLNYMLASFLLLAYAKFSEQT